MFNLSDMKMDSLVNPKSKQDILQLFEEIHRELKNIMDHLDHVYDECEKD